MEYRLFLLGLRLKIIRWWTTFISALTVGVLPYSLLSGFFAYDNLHEIPPAVLMKEFLVLGLFGLSGGIAFWLIWRYWVLKEPSTNSMKPINSLFLTYNVKDWLANSHQPRILYIFDQAACNLINEHRKRIITRGLRLGRFKESKMKLNHLNLTVTDTLAASKFLVEYFGMRSMGGNAGMRFLTDNDDDWGFVLTLTKVGKNTEVKYPGIFHIGFFVESEDIVNETYLRLKDAGFDVPAPERNNHAYGFYVQAPGEFTVELGA